MDGKASKGGGAVNDDESDFKVFIGDDEFSILERRFLTGNNLDDRQRRPINKCNSFTAAAEPRGVN